MAASGSILGSAVRRVEDPGILLGAVQYFDDLQVDGLLHLVFVRSTIAHARINSIELGSAERAPGVQAIYTSENLPLVSAKGIGMVADAFARPPLARGVVRFVGDIVGAVVADSHARGVDAAEMVVVDYDPLPAIVDPEAALEDDAVRLFPEHGSNVAIESSSAEDAALLDDADVVVAARFENQRVAAVPMEPNGVVVEVCGDELIVHVPTQNVFSVRDKLAKSLGMNPERVRVIAPAVGGGFGAKLAFYPEYAIAGAIARELGKAVKWTETRSENMVAMHHGRGQVQHIELGLKLDGTFTALRGRIVQDAGAYPAAGAFLPHLTRMMGQGVYRIPRVELSIKSVTTNTTPTGAYRGAGRPEATAFLERIVDIAARELGLDPVELRRKNLLRRDEFPLTTATGAHYDTGDYAKALDEALRIAGYDELRREQAERRASGDIMQIGIGVSTYVEVTAGGQFQEFASVEVHVDGSVTATVGTAAHGQGHETAFAMIVGDRLGVPRESVRIVQSDTKLVPRGQGTGGSRSLQIGGSGVYRASDAVLDKARYIAAHLLEAGVEDIVIHEDGRLGVVGVPTRAFTWGELAAAAQDPSQRPADITPGLSAALDFNQGEASYPFGAHVAVIEIDTETGRVVLVRHIAVDDCGRILNPLLVTGQQHGGIAQGVAQALYEGFVYDGHGNPLTANLLDYAVPAAADLPSFEASNTETPTPLNPLGAKGIGEAGTIGSAPAVHNAVIDALSFYGIKHLDMPLTAERVWRSLSEG